LLIKSTNQYSFQKAQSTFLSESSSYLNYLESMLTQSLLATRAVESEVPSSDSDSDSDSWQLRLSDSDSNSDSRTTPTFSCISYL